MIVIMVNIMEISIIASYRYLILIKSFTMTLSIALDKEQQYTLDKF